MKKRILAAALTCTMALTPVCTPLMAAAEEESSGSELSTEYSGETISVIICNSSFMEQIEADIGEFEEATGITVEFESLTDSQVSNKVAVSSAAGGTDLDVFGYRPLQEQLLYVQNGWMEPLNSYFEDDEDYDYEDFFESAREITTVDDVAYGIPYLTEREILYYNTEMFEEAGLDGPPETYDELVEYCEILNDPDNGVYALALRGEGNAAVTQFSGFLRGFGGDFYDEEGNATMNTEEAIEALQFYGMLCREYCSPGVLSMNWSETMTQFTQGLAAMRIDCDSQYAYALDEESSLIVDSVGYAVFPEGPEGTTPFNVTGWALGIGSNSEHKGASWEFIKWATGKEEDVKGMQAGNSSARTSTWENEEATSAYPEELTEVINESNPIGIATDRPYMVDGGEARTLIGELITAAIEGVTDEELQAQADDVNEQLQALLDAEKEG
ncbi:MAG: sugar ABC transporter substrate-binding protein [Lachnospiraceae bacterium]|nr:sugar ABC transporter substrate-binding protein [Lachnospiraceae bacterium]